MDRDAFLKSLPFLHSVSPSNKGPPSIWKHHWKQIHEHQVESAVSNTSATCSSTGAVSRSAYSTAHVDLLGQQSGTCSSERKAATTSNEGKIHSLFSCHALSIEPIAHHDGQSTGVAFFAKNRAKDLENEISDMKMNGCTDEDRDKNTNHDDSEENGHHPRDVIATSTTNDDDDGNNDMGKDPALLNFEAFLLPAFASNCEEYGDEEGDTDGSSIGADSRGAYETSILYFLIDAEDGQDLDIYCVDHYKIRSIQIEPSPTSAINTQEVARENINEVRKPMSILLSFDSCVFRVFPHNINNIEESEMDIMRQERYLQDAFVQLKNFMIEDGKKRSEFSTRSLSQSPIKSQSQSPTKTNTPMNSQSRLRARVPSIYDSDSPFGFISYLSCLSHPFHIDNQSSNEHENAQTSNDIAMEDDMNIDMEGGNSGDSQEDSTVINDTNLNANGESSGEAEHGLLRGESSRPSKKVKNNQHQVNYQGEHETHIQSSSSQSTSEKCLEAYGNSWKSMEALHSLLKLHSRGKISGSLDESDPLFVNLENSCARENAMSFLDVQGQKMGIDLKPGTNIASFMAREEDVAVSRLSSIQSCVDDCIRQIYPPRHENDERGSCNAEEISEHTKNLLQSYKEAVKSRHQLAFLPKR